MKILEINSCWFSYEHGNTGNQLILIQFWVWIHTLGVWTYILGIWTYTLGIWTYTLGIWAYTLGIWTYTLSIWTYTLGVRAGGHRAQAPNIPFGESLTSIRISPKQIPSQLRSRLPRTNFVAIYSTWCMSPSLFCSEILGRATFKNIMVSPHFPSKTDLAHQLPP